MTNEKSAAGMDIVLLFKSEGLMAMVMASAPLRMSAPILIAMDCFFETLKSNGNKKPSVMLKTLTLNTAIPVCCQ